MRWAKLICVSVDVRVKGRVVRLRLVARSIRRAVEIAGPLDDDGRARLVLPIDGERFFVDGRARMRGEVLAGCAPRGRPARAGEGRRSRGG